MIEEIAKLLYDRAGIVGKVPIRERDGWGYLPWDQVSEAGKKRGREDAVAVAALIRRTCNDAGMDTNPGARRDGEEFEFYVERALVSIQERLDNMAVDIAGLEVEETTLATVVPELASLIGTLNTHVSSEEERLKAKETELTAKEAEVAGDATALAAVRAELATAQGELAAVKAVQEKLAPVVSEAEKLVPAPAAPAASAAPAAPIAG